MVTPEEKRYEVHELKCFRHRMAKGIDVMSQETIVQGLASMRSLFARVASQHLSEHQPSNKNDAISTDIGLMTSEPFTVA